MCVVQSWGCRLLSLLVWIFCKRTGLKGSATPNNKLPDNGPSYPIPGIVHQDTDPNVEDLLRCLALHLMGCCRTLNPISVLGPADPPSWAGRTGRQLAHGVHRGDVLLSLLVFAWRGQQPQRAGPTEFAR